MVALPSWHWTRAVLASQVSKLRRLSCPLTRSSVCSQASLDDYLFLSHEKRGMAVSTVQAMVKKYAYLANLPVTPYTAPHVREPTPQ